MNPDKPYFDIFSSPIVPSDYVPEGKFCTDGESFFVNSKDLEIARDNADHLNTLVAFPIPNLKPWSVNNGENTGIQRFNSDDQTPPEARS